MPLNDSDVEVYPNSPLTDVVCEIRFPGELEVECNRHVFWERVRSTYPHILVPMVEDGKPPALSHYRFRDEQASRHVAVALNSLAFSETKYSGHVLYIQEFCRLAEIFHDCFPKIDKVSRAIEGICEERPFDLGSSTTVGSPERR
jgi:uncharacterized protein (TIGR04255 family)